jgi:hypothetical protein
MNNRLLGKIALMGAPCLCIGSIVVYSFPAMAGGWFYGVYGSMYITGWMCTMELLRRAKATGNNTFGKTILWVILGSLFLANASNVYAFFAPNNRSTLMVILDSFWPISNLLLLIVGITVIVSKGIRGWGRFVPLIAGCWFPFAMATKIWPSSMHFVFYIVATYSAIAWILLALVAIIHTKASSQETFTHLRL